MFSSERFSRPSASAAVASFQMSGASSAELTSTSRFFLSSKSKIPPEVLEPLRKVLQAGFGLVQSFGIHGQIFIGKGEPVILAALAREGPDADPVAAVRPRPEEVSAAASA